MAPVEMSVVQSFCCWTLIIFEMFLTWELDGMLEVLEEMNRGRREKVSAEAAQ